MNTQILDAKKQHPLDRPPPYLSSNIIIIKEVIKQVQLCSQRALTHQQQQFQAGHHQEPVLYRIACGIQKRCRLGAARQGQTKVVRVRK